VKVPNVYETTIAAGPTGPRRTREV
jgi:hypothetical protein